MKSWSFCLNLFISLSFNLNPTETVVSVPGIFKSEYVQEGDINIGFLISIHDSADAFDRANWCSDGWYSNSYSMHYAELLPYAVSLINKREDLLPNITLGYVVKDSCNKDLSALSRALYFIPNSEQLCNTTDRNYSPEASVPRRVVGILGPGTSRQSVMVAPLMSAANIPMISTFATSDELSDKTRFEYFLRLVPPDRDQVRALLGIARYFGWSYIAVIYTDGSYGEYGFKAVETIAQEYDMCIGYSHRILRNYGEEQHQEVVARLEQNENAKAVILFGSRIPIRNFLSFIGRQNRTLTRVWLAGDVQCNNYDYQNYPDMGRAALGMLCISFPSQGAPGFHDYMENEVTPWTSDNPWLKKYWENFFDCSWDMAPDNCNNYTSLAGRIGSGSFYSGKVLDGTEALSHAIHDVITQWCPQMFISVDSDVLASCLTGHRVLSSLKQVSFSGVEQFVQFGHDGEIVPQYIINHVKYISAEDVFRASKIAEWSKRDNENGKLTIDSSQLVWGEMDLGKDVKHMNGTSGFVVIPESLCSRECGPRQYKIRLEQKCCWNCHDCQENGVLVDNSTNCLICPEFTWPDDHTQSQCVDIPLTYLNLQGPIGITLSVMAAMGVFVGLSILCVFIWKRNTKLIKATNKQLSMLMLLASVFASLLIFVFMQKPSILSCGIRQFGFHMVVSLLYCPMFIKTSRIYRIFAAGRKGVSRPKFVSSGWQIVLAILAIGLQVVILIVTAMIEPPFIEKSMPILMEKMVELSCGENIVKFIVPLGYNVLMILVCAVLGYYSRNLPENFNESWYIFISVSTTLFMWLVFIPTYFTSFFVYNQVAILGFCLLLNVYVSLGCLFLPKTYAIFFVDENKMAFSTMKTVTQSTVAPGTT